MQSAVKHNIPRESRFGTTTADARSRTYARAHVVISCCEWRRGGACFSVGGFFCKSIPRFFACLSHSSRRRRRCSSRHGFRIALRSVQIKLSQPPSLPRSLPRSFPSVVHKNLNSRKNARYKSQSRDLIANLKCTRESGGGTLSLNETVPISGPFFEADFWTGKQKVPFCPTFAAFLLNDPFSEKFRFEIKLRRVEAVLMMVNGKCIYHKSSEPAL